MSHLPRKPVIGITSDDVDGKPAYYTGYGYVDAVVAAGGVPLILPYRASASDIPDLVDLLDGVIFSGGNDLDPAAWGETVHPNSTPIRPERETYERALMTEIERRRLPALGICLGSQLMNVHRGGSMRQYIPDLGLSPTLEHRRQDGVDSRHTVHVSPNSVLSSVIGAGEVQSNSAHKQAMNAIGAGLRVVATSADGVVEALEDPSMPLWLGVQWHPERIYTEGNQIRLFTLLVEKSAAGNSAGNFRGNFGGNSGEINA